MQWLFTWCNCVPSLIFWPQFWEFVKELANGYVEQIGYQWWIHNIWLLSHFAFGLQFSIVSPMHTIWKDKIFCPCALWWMITSCFSSDVLLASFFGNNSWKLGMKCKFITCQLQIITIDKNGLKFVMHSSHFYLTINSTYIEVKYIL